MKNKENISIIDYGLVNIGSIKNMLLKIGYGSKTVKNSTDLEHAKKIILPGVGSFDNGVKELKKLSINSMLSKKVNEEKVPILGICLGMQLLGNNSEEGKSKGLGFINSKCEKISFDKKSNLKVPHMGWNKINAKNTSKLFLDLPLSSRFYFTHSYHMICKDNKIVTATTNYGKNITASIQKDNIFGVQFHPEKSHKYGMIVLKNFAEL